MTSTLSLKVVSQEKLVVETSVRSVSAPTVQGEVTILPGHIPLFAQLQAGELRYNEDGQEHYVVISPGFLNVTPNNEITIMIDSAVNDREISLEKAEAAIEQAKSSIATAADRRELLMAEASLKRAMLEVQVAQKTRRTKI
jgi:F-type H+-transporting ATPase subunit epsilon